MSEASTTTSATTAMIRYESRRPVRQRSAPSRTARAVSSARRVLHRRARWCQQRPRASAPPRASFVMVLCTDLINPLSASTSFVRFHPFPPKSPTPTKNGVESHFASVQALRRLTESRVVLFAEDPACRCPSQTSSSAAARDAAASASTDYLRLVHGVVGHFRSVSRSHLPVVGLVTCGIGSR